MKELKLITDLKPNEAIVMHTVEEMQKGCDLLKDAGWINDEFKEMLIKYSHGGRDAQYVYKDNSGHTCYGTIGYSGDGITMFALSDFLPSLISSTVDRKELKALSEITDEDVLAASQIEGLANGRIVENTENYIRVEDDTYSFEIFKAIGKIVLSKNGKEVPLSTPFTKEWIFHRYSNGVNNASQFPTIDPQHKQITGWDTPQEHAAYDLGREHEQKVTMEWIEKWDGSTNSGMGELLNKKFIELASQFPTSHGDAINWPEVEAVLSAFVEKKRDITYIINALKRTLSNSATSKVEEELGLLKIHCEHLENRLKQADEYIQKHQEKELSNSANVGESVDWEETVVEVNGVMVSRPISELKKEFTITRKTQ